MRGLVVESLDMKLVSDTLYFFFFVIALLRDPVHPVTFPKAVGFILRIHLAPSKANSRARK